MGKKGDVKIGRQKSLTSILYRLSFNAGKYVVAANAETAQPKTLKIGYLLCLTGWYSVFDAVEEKDVKIVAQMINDGADSPFKDKNIILNWWEKMARARLTESRPGPIG
jgi:hypothetical protein